MDRETGRGGMKTDEPMNSKGEKKTQTQLQMKHRKRARKQPKRKNVTHEDKLSFRLKQQINWT